MQPAIYLNLVEDFLIESNANGSLRTIVLTPKRMWGLGLNLADFTTMLRIANLTTNGGVTVKWQYSFDGINWKVSSTDAVAQKTANGDYASAFTGAADMLPFVRLSVEIKDTTAGALQMTAEIGVWAYYKYRV